MAWNEPGKGKDPWNGGGDNRKPNQGSGPPDLDQLWKRFRERFGGGKGNGAGNGGSGGGNNGVPLGLLGIIVGLLLAAWVVFGGLYVVQPGEKGVVLRFGNYERTAQPGWHWHLPYPIAVVSKVDVQQVRRASNRAVMLTKDENIVDVEISAQYRISNAMKYLFQIDNPGQTVQELLQSAVREVVGTSDMNQVIQEGVQVNQLENAAIKKVDLKPSDPLSSQSKASSNPSANHKSAQNTDPKLAAEIQQKQNDYPQITDRSRAMLPSNVKKIMQYMLNKYDAGIHVIAVNVQYAQPPEQVQSAFQEAIKAREQEEQAKNIARAYARDVVARAEGEQAQMIAQAHAYKTRKINRAEGQADRFDDLLTQYEKAPNVTHTRLYLETMSDVLSSTPVVLNESGSNIMSYLPLDRLLKKSKQSSTGGGSGASGASSKAASNGNASGSSGTGSGNGNASGSGSSNGSPSSGSGSSSSNTSGPRDDGRTDNFSGNSSNSDAGSNDNDSIDALRSRSRNS